MSVVEKLEEAIYKKRWKVPDGLGLGKIEVVSLSDFQREFVAFKKDYDSQIHVPQKKLEEVVDYIEETARGRGKGKQYFGRYIEVSQVLTMLKELLAPSTPKRVVLSNGKEMEKVLEKVEKTK